MSTSFTTCLSPMEPRRSGKRQAAMPSQSPKPSPPYQPPGAPNLAAVADSATRYLDGRNNMTQLRPHPPQRNVLSFHRMEIAVDDEEREPSASASLGSPQDVPEQVASGQFRPIEARQSSDPVLSLEERGMLRALHMRPTSLPLTRGLDTVSQGLARKQANRKAREQQRRDRLKDALDRLAHVVPQEYTNTSDSSSSVSVRRGEPTVRDAKVDIVESAIYYITEMKKEGHQQQQQQPQPQLQPQPTPAGEGISNSGTEDEVSVVLIETAPCGHRCFAYTTCDIVLSDSPSDRQRPLRGAQTYLTRPTLVKRHAVLISSLLRLQDVIIRKVTQALCRVLKMRKVTTQRP